MPHRSRSHPQEGCFGLVVNPGKPGATELARELALVLTEHGAEVKFDESAAELLGGTHKATSWAALGHECSLIIVLGGDGTLLRTARLLRNNVPPLAGINTGRLGFLTTAAIEDKERFLQCLCDREWTVSRRRQLQIRCQSRDGTLHELHALNEATITRGSISRSIQVEARINGGWLNRYSGDGLIVATPTGSTAYSLSAGGPIVSPESAVFVITPICGHALSNRTLVVSDDSDIELIPIMGSGGGETLLTVDGAPPISLAPGLTVSIHRSTIEVPLVQLPGHRFYHVLHQKLGWSGSRV